MDLWKLLAFTVVFASAIQCLAFMDGIAIPPNIGNYMIQGVTIKPQEASNAILDYITKQIPRAKGMVMVMGVFWMGLLVFFGLLELLKQMAKDRYPPLPPPPPPPEGQLPGDVAVHHH